MSGLRQKNLHGQLTVHYKKVIQILEANIFPYIGHKPIESLKPLEMLRLIQKIEERGALEVSKKAYQRCLEIFRYAVITGRCEYNPCSGLSGALKKQERQHYPHLLGDELAPFLVALSAYSGTRLIAIATRLLIITGVRTGELRGARWSEINLDKGVWEIPAERMKKRKPHIVPLSRQAIKLVKESFDYTGGFPLIFIGRNDSSKPISDATIIRVFEKLGYKGKVTGHGFRHTMSTILHEHNFNSAHIELQLAHVDKNSIRGTYNHAQYLEDRRVMLQWYADHLDELEIQKM